MAKVVSIEVGYSFIKICEMDYKAKTPRVYRFAMVPTPLNVIEDGYLKESAGLRGAIREALTQNKIKTKRVIFTVASSKIVNREVVLPPVKPNMMDSMIKANISDYFPIDLSDHEISHVVLETFKEGENAGKSRVLIVAAEKSLVSSYEALAESCGLSLVGLDFVGNSIYQAVKKEVTQKTAMILKIEESQTTITVVRDNNMMLQRSINYGIDEAIREVTASSAFDVSDDKEAWELIKRRCCIKVALNNDTRIVEPDLERDDSAEFAQARINVTRSLSPLLNSITRVIDFYNSRNAEHIDRIYIMGMGGDMSGLSKLMTNELGIKTTVFKKLEGIVWHPTMGDGDLFNYVACIGATIAPVGFVSSDKQKKQQSETNSKSLAVLIGIFFVVASAALAANGYMTYKEAVDEESRLKSLESTYIPAEQIYQRYNAMVKLYAEVFTGHLMTSRPNDNILEFITELEQKLSTDVSVMEFSSNDSQAILRIQAADKETAAGIIQNLREFSSLQYVTVDSIQEVEEEIKDETGEEAEDSQTEEDEEASFRHFVEFSVTCSYYPSSYEVQQILEQLQQNGDQFVYKTQTEGQVE